MLVCVQLVKANYIISKKRSLMFFKFPIKTAAITVIVLMVCVGGRVWANELPQVSTSMTVLNIVHFTNEARVNDGLETLLISPHMTVAAQEKAESMAKRRELSHTLSDGTTAWQFIKSNGYCYEYAGENIAMFFTAADEVVDAWLESPTHRENVLSNKYTDIGIGITEMEWLGYKGILVVQLFGSKKSEEYLSSSCV